MDKLSPVVPRFATEAEEADWWFDNRHKIAKEFAVAIKEGRVGRGTVAKRGNTPTTTIRLDPADIERAKLAAEKRGIKYQTYLKMLIHTALNKESALPTAGRGQGRARSSAKH